MFGYVIANIDKLTADEKRRYQACYCGLCRALGSRHGTLSRITLTYDMTFLVLLLSSLHEGDAQNKRERCIMHPMKRHEYWQNEYTDYAADMNVALAYHNFLDNWTDDKKVISLCEAKLFEREYARVAALNPIQCAEIRGRLTELSEIEKAGELNPDIPASCFGTLMAAVFVYREGEHSDALRAFGRALGKFIYIMDACIDLKSDIKKERYNPLISYSSGDFEMILNALMAECTEQYRLLPVRRDQGLIENILYSGVWTRYKAGKANAKGEQTQ